MTTGEEQGMIRLTLFVLMLLIALPAPAARNDDPTAPTNREIKQMIEFGISLGKQGLWKEALYRWREALRHDPENPILHNNIGVALESQGDLEGAREAYRRAEELKLRSRYLRRNREGFEELFTALEKYESEFRTPPPDDAEPAEGEAAPPAGEAPPTGEPPEEDGE
jgi:tetratricopeptide (TPR) repeat protein